VDDDFFLSVVNETPGARVLDLGCGTGRLALGLAAAGHLVTGVDPAAASLEAARNKAGSERVTWVEGSTDCLPDAAFDVAVMTSHVAQFFVTDDEWARALADLRRALVPGGRLVFDTRDPRARRWERWNPVESRDRVTVADGVEVMIWTEVTAVDSGVVTFVHHYTFSDGDERRSEATLRFRSEERGALHVGGRRLHRGAHLRRLAPRADRRPGRRTPGHRPVTAAVGGGQSAGVADRLRFTAIEAGLDRLRK
jgi:SAM-dependent methyltransferase